MSRRYDATMAHTVEARTESAPGPLRFTRSEYHRMAEAGLFEGRRVELLEGEVIAMTPQGAAHASAVSRIVRALVSALGENASVRPQLPLALGDRSEPEPDVAVCNPEPRDYAARHPGPGDVLLVIEVADTSLGYDRGPKAAAYARAGVPLLWIVDLTARHVEVHGEPDSAGRYRRRQSITGEAQLELPGGGAVAVSALLPIA